MKKSDVQFYYKNNRLQQMRGFCYTAQWGSITKAASYMGLTHSSVSLQIKSLEQELGHTLLERNGPRIVLTSAGKIFYEIAIVHVNAISQLYDTFTCQLDNLENKRVVIAANSTSLNFILPSLLRQYLEMDNEMQASIHFAEQEEAIEKLFNDSIDVALLPRREHMLFPKSCHYIPVYYFRPSLITRKDHPLAGKENLSIQEIMEYPITLPAENLRVIPNLYEIFPKERLASNHRIHFINWETTRKYIEEGLVISISSDVIIGKEDMLHATPLTHLFPMVDYGFVARGDRALPVKVKKLIEIAQFTVHEDTNPRYSCE